MGTGIHDTDGMETTTMTELTQEEKRGKAWDSAWRQLKPQFERAGITFCEVGYSGCTRFSFLTPCHSLKRRNCTTPELLREIIIACQSCHAKLEIMPEFRMAFCVREIIAIRPTQPARELGFIAPRGA